MSMYSGVIKEQAKVIETQNELVMRYHSLAQELIDVLAQHIDVSDYERRLMEISRKEGICGTP